MDRFIFSLFVFGTASLLMVWMPFISKKTGISYSLFYLSAGVILYSFFPDNLPNPLPQFNKTAVLHLTELIVIISLMGAGIKIDQRFSFKKWALPLRLVFIAMVLCIVVTVAYGYFILEFTLSAAVLLGAVLAPTDPVLASDVQVGPPNEKKHFGPQIYADGRGGHK